MVKIRRWHLVVAAVLAAVVALSAQRRIADIFQFSTGQEIKPCGTDGTTDPTTGGGLVAPIGSMCLRSDTGDGYRKTGAGATDWEELGTGSGGGGSEVVEAAGSVVLLGSAAASSSAALSFTGIITADYDDYLIEFINIVPSTDASLVMRVSTNGGSSYDSGANYVNATWQANSGTFDGALNGGATDTEILVTNSVEATSNSLSGTMRLYGPGSTTLSKLITGQTSTFKSDGNFYSTLVSGRYSSATAIDAFQFSFASGTIVSGTIRVYGMSRDVGAGAGGSGGALTLIETQSPSGTGTVTFSSLGEYQNLRIVINARCTTAASSEAVAVRFNGDTGNNYDWQEAYTGQAIASGQQAMATSHGKFATVPCASAAANLYGPSVAEIPNYRGAAWKTGHSSGTSQTQTSAGNMYTLVGGFTWRSTAAITSVTVRLGSGNFVAGSTVSIYGVGNSSGAPAGLVDTSVVNGRLTTESGVCVSTADRLAQSTLYFTPGCGAGGNRIALYTGSYWRLISFTELSLALSGLTSGRPYDVFIDYTAGAPALELVAWTNDTTRATALALQDGVLVQTSDPDSRYVGTIYTTSTTETEDSAAKRFVWNLHNQEARRMFVRDTTDSWTYTTNTWRQANAGAANQLDYVTGIASTLLEATVISIANASTSQNIAVGVGVDSTTADSSDISGIGASTGIGYQHHAVYRGTPGVGRHRLVWLEIGGGPGTVTWWGDDGANVPPRRSGMSGRILN
jgi:hypothetical protein